MTHPRHYLMQTALRKWAFERVPATPAPQPEPVKDHEKEPETVVA